MAAVRTKRRISHVKRISITDNYDPWLHADVWVMVDPPNGSWQLGKVLSRNLEDGQNAPTKFEIVLSSSKRVIILAKLSTSNDLEYDVVKRHDPNHDYSLDTVDMTTLLFLNEPEMIECLKRHYLRNFIYTNIGPVLFAINPFQKLPIYSEAHLKLYCQSGLTKSTENLPPHVFQIADYTYRKMFVDKFDPDKRENQVVIVNGESGAGKTETTKHVLHYLASVSSGVTTALNISCEDLDIEKRILSSNPITESFGNAKTSRNNNSSRFGKFVELSYSGDGFIESSSIQTYLLETTRVTHQLADESSFHVFYEAFAGLHNDDKTDIGIISLEKFRYINNSASTTKKNSHDSEVQNYHILCEAMDTCGIEERCHPHIFNIIFGILHLGNINFETNSETVGQDSISFTMDTMEHVKHACDLLGISEESLLEAVNQRKVNIAGSEIVKTLNLAMTRNAIDSLSMTIYLFLFKWIVWKINLSLSENASKENIASFIGVLDIAGFEYFKSNSFEQLCINYTNEKLQNHFNYTIFINEQEVYKREGLQWAFINYPNNEPCLELLESRKFGIFALCDEQLKLPKCTDEKLVRSLYERCSSSPHFSASKSERASFQFTIKHYACDVRYDAKGFLDKNTGEIASEYLECLSNSSIGLINEMVQSSDGYSSKRLVLLKKKSLRPTRSIARYTSFGSDQSKSRGNTSKSIGQKQITVSGMFTKQLNELMDKIKRTRSHFIRCIKPNSSLKPSTFDDSMVMQQLRCGGALEAVKVFRAGFSNRFEFQAFVSRFACLSFPCSGNPLVVELLKCKTLARKTYLNRHWKLAAMVLVSVAPLTIYVLQTLGLIDSKKPQQHDVAQGLQLGVSLVFLRPDTFEYLEMLKHKVLGLATSLIQYRWRSRQYLHKKGVQDNGMIIQNSLCMMTTMKYRRLLQEISATILLQRRVRVYLCQLELRNCIAAARTIATMYRKWSSRRKAFLVFHKTKAAIIIQSIGRMYICRRGYLAKKKLATMLQLRHSRRVYHKHLLEDAVKRNSKEKPEKDDLISAANMSTSSSDGNHEALKTTNYTRSQSQFAGNNLITTLPLATNGDCSPVILPGQTVLSSSSNSTSCNVSNNRYSTAVTDTESRSAETTLTTVPTETVSMSDLLETIEKLKRENEALKEMQLQYLSRSPSSPSSRISTASHLLLDPIDNGGITTTSNGTTSEIDKEYLTLMMKIDHIEQHLSHEKKIQFQVRRNQYLKQHLKEAEQHSQEKGCFSSFLSWFA